MQTVQNIKGEKGPKSGTLLMSGIVHKGYLAFNLVPCVIPGESLSADSSVACGSPF